MPGEAAVIAAGLKHARRFRQISLPALWEIAQTRAKERVEERMKRHALRTVWEIHNATADKAALRKKLADAGEKALVAQLDEWTKK